MKKKILIVFLICCMLLGVASPAMAATTEPPTDSNYPLHHSYRDGGYIIGSHSLSGYTVLLTWDKEISVVYNPSLKCFKFNRSVDDGSYTVSYSQLSEDGTEWFNSSSITVGITGEKTYYFNNPVEGNVLIYDTNGLVFFSPPLLLDLGILEVKMSPLLNQAVGMIQTLLPYGISCLALLISLPLLLRVLRRFLG